MVTYLNQFQLVALIVYSLSLQTAGSVVISARLNSGDFDPPMYNPFRRVSKLGTIYS